MRKVMVAHTLYIGRFVKEKYYLFGFLLAKSYLCKRNGQNTCNKYDSGTGCIGVGRVMCAEHHGLKRYGNKRTKQYTAQTCNKSG